MWENRSFSLAKDSNICIDIRNPLSDFEIREKVILNPGEYVPMEENSHQSPCHFIITWEGNKKKSFIEVLDGTATKNAIKKKLKKSKAKEKSGAGIPRDFTSDDSGTFVPILAMECRGVEPYAFHPMGNEFIVISEGGNTFEEDVDLSEGDWADYDMENNNSLSICEFESKFITL